MFVGRERELAKLQAMYSSDRFEMPVFYGRRRVGKTTLITEFCKDKKAIYYQAIKATPKTNLDGLSNAVWLVLMPGQEMPPFTSLEQLLQYVTDQAHHERLILVIDEYPYWAENDTSLSSILQSSIDHHMLDSKLFLILCGSSMSFMENQVLGYKSPLYGRRTAQFKVQPFTFFEARQMLTGFKPEDQAILYGCTGGIPLYMHDVDPRKTVDENIVDMFFDPVGRLFEEPGNLLKQELNNPAVYQTLLQAIAGGASRLNELAQAISKETSAATAYVNQLIELGIVVKETPVTEKPGRKTIYSLCDSMFRFWYSYVMPGLSLISAGHGNIFYQQRVKPNLSNFMGHVFEQIAQDHIMLLMGEGKLPVLFTEIGRWWGTDPRQKAQTEIDIMADGGDAAIFAECKWKNELTSLSVLETLQYRSELFPKKKAHLYLYSKSGFSDTCISKAADIGATLITFSDMCE